MRQMQGKGCSVKCPILMTMSADRAVLCPLFILSYDREPNRKAMQTSLKVGFLGFFVFYFSQQINTARGMKVWG
jgi:hypothetical protein